MTSNKQDIHLVDEFNVGKDIAIVLSENQRAEQVITEVRTLPLNDIGNVLTQILASNHCSHELFRADREIENLHQCV
ncbi:unannotated protein [freshwater metagenome]|uniref:Unannotated protein n=1 Tax=freshwater metagenome TaxID=449393 RepID=A0A6J6KHG9_9ZZZZ